MTAAALRAIFWNFYEASLLQDRDQPLLAGGYVKECDIATVTVVAWASPSLHPLPFFPFCSGAFVCFLLARCTYCPDLCGVCRFGFLGICFLDMALILQCNFRTKAAVGEVHVW